MDFVIGAESPPDSETIHVIAAVIEVTGRLLIAQRPSHKRHGGKWEFPGGKLEPGESYHEAAARELTEELGVRVVQTSAPQFSVSDPESVFVIDFVPTVIEGLPEAREHQALAWVTPDELFSYDLAECDRAYAVFRSSR